jgi:hypothetical protein
MVKLGFALIKTCVTTVNFAVIVNGPPIGHICPIRGICQGDPISPHLFMICFEALSSLLSQAERSGRLSGVPTSKKELRLNHRFFANDSLLFCQADPQHWHRLNRLLAIYERASGLRLNKEKTDIFFRRSTIPKAKKTIMDLTSIPVTQRYDKYLGLLSLVGKS